MKCDHYETRHVWSSWENDWTGEIEGEWIEESTCLQEDISIGAFKCKRCGEVGYYTGKWKAHYEAEAAKGVCDA